MAHPIVLVSIRGKALNLVLNSGVSYVYLQEAHKRDFGIVVGASEM